MYYPEFNSNFSSIFSLFYTDIVVNVVGNDERDGGPLARPANTAT